MKKSLRFIHVLSLCLLLAVAFESRQVEACFNDGIKLNDDTILTSEGVYSVASKKVEKISNLMKILERKTGMGRDEVHYFELTNLKGVLTHYLLSRVNKVSTTDSLIHRSPGPF